MRAGEKPTRSNPRDLAKATISSVSCIVGNVLSLGANVFWVVGLSLWERLALYLYSCN